MKTTLVSLGAKNVHKTLAPWCLKAYCNAYGIADIAVVEGNINNNFLEVLAKIADTKPDVVGFSCYIWNIEFIEKLSASLKKLLPHVKIVLGGPEVSFENDLSDFPFADFIIKGQGEEALFRLLKNIENTPVKNIENTPVVSDGFPADFSDFPSPFTSDYFASFSREQIPAIENRLIYYESSRGCPFSCAYCLSSCSSGISFLPLERVKSELTLLLEKGAKCIKFVDRTFNADKTRAEEILQFVGSLKTACVFHFEAAADLFDKSLLRTVRALPIGRVQFEIGVQSTNSDTLCAAQRKTDTGKVLENIKTLSDFGNCRIHADLIAGLPHETFYTMMDGINRLAETMPHIIQLGFLKFLKGAKIREDSFRFGAVYVDFAPYEVLKTDTLGFDDLNRLKKIEAVIDRYYNSGLFAESVRYAIKIFSSPARFFIEFAESGEKFGINTAVSLKNAYSKLFDFLCLHGDKSEAEHCIKLDCLSVDSKGQLPDTIIPNRNKRFETEYGKTCPSQTPFRIEFFEFDRTHRLFVYDQKNPVTNRYAVRVYS